MCGFFTNWLVPKCRPFFPTPPLYMQTQQPSGPRSSCLFAYLPSTHQSSSFFCSLTLSGAANSRLLFTPPPKSFKFTEIHRLSPLNCIKLFILHDILHKKALSYCFPALLSFCLFIIFAICSAEFIFRRRSLCAADNGKNQGPLRSPAPAMLPFPSGPARSPGPGCWGSLRDTL